MTQILKIKDKTQHLHVMQSMQKVCCAAFLFSWVFLRKLYQTIKNKTLNIIINDACFQHCLKTLSGESSIMLYKTAKKLLTLKSA